MCPRSFATNRLASTGTKVAKTEHQAERSPSGDEVGSIVQYRRS